MENTTTSTASARVWYEKHRVEHNAKRREAYAAKPEVQGLAKHRAAVYRQSRRNGRAIERELYRTVAGASVRVYTTGQVADKLGCSAQMLRNWEARGIIPHSLFPDAHRLYMKHQISLLASLHARLSGASTRAEKAHVIDKWKTSIVGKW